MEPPVSPVERFEGARARLRKMAYRMLGSLSDAEDAVQETWLRLNRTGPDGVDNLDGWLTTVTARVCLDMLRARRSRREVQPDSDAADPISRSEPATDPEQEALLAESVGLALLVVLETLPPAERVAFVLHDVFDVPFDEIAPIVGKSADAARQLASRGRRRIHREPTAPEADLKSQRAVVDAYLAATRNRDMAALLAVLDPDVVLRIDPEIVPHGLASEVRGASAVAGRALGYPRIARFAVAAMIDGTLGIIVAPRGRLFGVLILTSRYGKITEIDTVTNADRLRQLDLSLPSWGVRGTDRISGA